MSNNSAGLIRFTRRGFLSTAIASSGLAVMGGIGLLTAPAARAGKPGGGGGGKGTVTRNPLEIPPTVSPGNYGLAAAPALVDLGGSKTSSVWAYTGLYLLHCHKLEHEDMGMMANFEVI
jgi:FtsP/CotA-like multicopper oxidase with cupredoxin domain